jgi:predicted kinase
MSPSRRPVLIVVSGLPGTGKTTVAEALARSRGIPVFAIAWILGSLAQHGILEAPDRGPAAYEILTMLAKRQLMLDQSAILDGMIGSSEMRERWRRLAHEHSAAFIAIECTCSDAELHRARVERRRECIPGWPDPDWEHVENMRAGYESWTGKRLVVDSVEPYERNLHEVERYIRRELTRYLTDRRPRS